MDIKQVGLEGWGTGLILAPDRIKWWAVVNTVMKVCFIKCRDSVPAVELLAFQ